MAATGMADQHPATAPPLYKRGDIADPTEAIFYGCGYCSQVLLEKRELETHIRLTHCGAPYCCTPAPLNPDQAELLHVPHSTLFAEGIPLSEVARHNIGEDCWCAINGKVYDLTEFLDRHPGGRNSLQAWAGKDATKMFNDVHGGVNVNAYLRPEAYLGELGIKENMMSDCYWDELRQARVKELREELHYFCDEEGAVASASPDLAIAGLRLTSDKVTQRLKTLEERKKAAIEAQDFLKAEDLKKVIEKLQRQASQAGAVAPAEEQGGIPMSEVAKHNKMDDCWVALNGEVLDLTEFLLHCEDNKAKNPILAMAGRDATLVFNKIQNRFPSDGWNKEHLRPEYRIGEAKKDSPLSHHDAKIKELQEELRRLEGPSDTARAAAQAAAQAKQASKAAGAATKGELDRYPKLKDIQSSKGALPLMTRADVAQHSTKEAKPYIIVHNKVYDLTSLLGSHPGGDDVLMSKAGQDCTVEFEVFEHSEKSRVRRDQDMLVGAIVPEECEDAMAKAGGGADGKAADEPVDELTMYVKMKVYDALVLTAGVYAYKSLQHTKPLPSLMYSRALRHLHTIMAAGIFATLGTAQAAARADGLAKKFWIKLHKQTGVLMLFALLVRMVTRARSGIPPRFPGFPMVQFVESQSLRAFYALAFALPATGVAYEWFTYWAPNWAPEEDEERNAEIAKQSMIMHRKLGKFLNYVWLPFHLGYTTLWHASQGRGVIRKVSPFI